MTAARATSATIACFGEILWDVLPRGIFLGGAPLNVAYHLSRQNVRVRPISAVGRDFLGDEALRRVASWGLDGRSIGRRRDRPTGTVRVALDAGGAAEFQIASGVAWDRIVASRALLRAAAPAAIVFGTLALREPANRRTLTRILAAWPRALRVLDLNLRPPFDRPGPVAFALRQAEVVKLNDTELGRMNGQGVSSPAALERGARRFARTHAIRRVCVTAGKRGAGLLWDDRWHWEPARRIEVRDTVGAGDAFLGAFLAAILQRGAPPRAALAAACRLGEFVAARDGATPPYRVDARGKVR